MEYCSYNEILNKIYNIVKGNDRLLRLLFYKDDVDIDDYNSCPKLTSSQKRETVSKYIKKISNIKATNNEVGCYLNLKHRVVDFSSQRKRGTYQDNWSKILFDIVVTCSESIEELQDANRVIEILSELQKEFTKRDVDGIGYSHICGFSESNTVEGCIAYTLTLTMYDVNEAKLWN